MSTKTTTSVTHYHVQKSRREKFLEDWRNNWRTVVAVEDVAVQPTPRGSRVGVYVGADGDRQTRTVDALVHELDPGITTTVHRHSWDAVVLVVGGKGWFEIDGEHVDVAPGDSVYLPSWAWHRTGVDAGGNAPLRYMSFSSEPTFETMRQSVLEDGGHVEFSALPVRPPFSPGIQGDDSYTRRLRRVARQQEDGRASRLHTSFDSLELLNTPRGTRTTFLIDRAIGYRTTGITMAMLEFGPGRGQSMHRHPGEAWLYVIEGRGHSYFGNEPQGGETHEWKKGDLIVVDHFLWHQHFNDDPDNTAQLVRVHILDNLLETMRVLCDPLVLLEEPPDHIRDKQAGDPSTIQWPAVERPTWP